MGNRSRFCAEPVHVVARQLSVQQLIRKGGVYQWFALLIAQTKRRVVTVRLNTLLCQVSLKPPPNRTYAFPHIRLSDFS